MPLPSRMTLSARAGYSTLSLRLNQFSGDTINYVRHSSCVVSYILNVVFIFLLIFHDDDRGMAHPEVRPSDLRGLKFFRPIAALLDRLRGEAAHPNRELHYDQYASLLLLYFLTPAIASLRDLQRASDFKTVARKLG